MAGVLDASVHVDTAAAAGMALDGGAGVDDVELLPVGRDAQVVPGDHGHDGEQRTGGLPALGAAAGMVVRDVALDADGHRLAGAVTGERAALELLVARLDALVYRRMQLDRHGIPLFLVRK